MTTTQSPGRSTRIVIYISFLAVSFVTVAFGVHVWWIVAERNEARLAGAYACGYHVKVRVPFGVPNGVLESQCPEIQELARKHGHRL